MLHAKTAVADGRWARIGSTNLNVSSWIGNYELDVSVEDEGFAGAMEKMYLEDLSRATEIELGRRNAALPAVKRPPGARRTKGQGSVGRAGVGVLRAGRVVEAAITHRRELGPAESKVMLVAGLALLALAVAALFWPRLVAVPFAVLGAWIAVALLAGAYSTWARRGGGPSAGPPPREDGRR